MKNLFLLFQGKEESITDYTKTAITLLDMDDQAGVDPGWYKAMGKIA